MCTWFDNIDKNFVPGWHKFFNIMYHITWFDNHNMFLFPGSHELYLVHMISYSLSCSHDSFRYILCVHDLKSWTWTLVKSHMNFFSMSMKSCIMCWRLSCTRLIPRSGASSNALNSVSSLTILGCRNLPPPSIFFFFTNLLEKCYILVQKKGFFTHIVTWIQCHHPLTKQTF